MNIHEIHYRKLEPGESDEFKYELTAPYKQRLHPSSGYWHHVNENHLRWVDISAGWITLANGYRSDGPSGPTVDTKNWIRASFVHDGIYQLMKTGNLSITYRSQTDAEMRAILVEDGMHWFRRWYSWAGVRFGGGKIIRKWREENGIDVNL